MPTSNFDVTETLFWKGILVFVKYVMIACSVISTGCIIYSVILRYIFKINFYGSDEVILLFAFWLYFMGAVYGSYQNSHIKADLMNVYVKNIRIKDFINLIAQVITVVVNVILLIWAWDYLLWGLEKMPLSTGLKIPLVIPQSAIFFGLLLMAFFHSVHLVRNTYRFINFGYFSEPEHGDYMTMAMKNKFPQANVLLKEKINTTEKDKRDSEGGED